MSDKIIRQLNCPVCSQPMKKVKWELTNGIETFNVMLEVEKIVLRCPKDNVSLTLEIPTGAASDYSIQGEIEDI